MAKPIIVNDGWEEKCGKCGAYVTRIHGTGNIFHGGSESYEEWRTETHDYCPRCGEKVEREKDD